MKKEAVRKIGKSILLSDLVTLAVWIGGIGLIKVAVVMKDNIPQEIRVMYLLFVILYILFMIVLFYQTKMMHMLRRLEDNRR